MSGITITVDTSQWDDLSARLSNTLTSFVRTFLQQGTEVIQQTMANTVPVKTGNLRASINSEINDTQSITRTNTGYGLFVDQPTAQHVIRPNISKFLRFQIGSQVIYAKEVFHPATKGAYFIQNTVDQVSSQLKTIAMNVWNSLIGG